MHVTESLIEYFTGYVTGDNHKTNYKKGIDLIKLFNKHGAKEHTQYLSEARYAFTERKLRELNGMSALKKLIEEILDPWNWTLPLEYIEKNLQEVNYYLLPSNHYLVLDGMHVSVATTIDSLDFDSQYHVTESVLLDNIRR